MQREQMDEFYHQLRVLNQENDIQQKEAIMGITSHLAQPLASRGDYIGLLRFLSYYGERFLLPDILSLLKRGTFTRVVEFGAGFGWLGRGISNAFGVPALFIDKRQYVFTDIVADVETIQGRERVLEALNDGDLIVASELLHCLDSPINVMATFAEWPALIVEFNPSNVAYKESYINQISSFGCSIINHISDAFPDRITVCFRSGHHDILFVDGKGE